MPLTQSSSSLDFAQVRKRSLLGTITLISRSFLLQIVSTAGLFLLTVFLGRPEIGLFIAVNDLVGILGYFSDIGLAASLIQKKTQVTTDELRTCFTLQQILVSVLVITVVILSPVLVSFYHLSQNQVWLLYSLLTGFFLASLKTIPSVILERQLKFQVLASVEVVETIIFYAIAVFMAWMNYGVLAYAWAVVIRGLVGTIMLYILSPWPVGVQISFSAVRSLLKFGLPYQLNSLLATIKDRFLNIFLWKIITADGVGTIGWAASWSQKPLRFIMDNVTKVAFPGFSRLQDHQHYLGRAIEKMLFFISFFTFPLLAGISLSAGSFVKLFPGYSKWEVALIPLYLYCFNSALASVATPMTSILNAIGKVKVNTALMIMWSVLTWTITPIMAIKYGYLGVSYATGIISLFSVIPIIIVKRYVNFDLLNPVIKPALSTLIMIIINMLISTILPLSVRGLILSISVSGVVYFLVSYLLFGPRLLSDFRLVVNEIKNRHHN